MTTPDTPPQPRVIVQDLSEQIAAWERHRNRALRIAADADRRYTERKRQETAEWAATHCQHTTRDGIVCGSETHQPREHAVPCQVLGCPALTFNFHAECDRCLAAPSINVDDEAQLLPYVAVDKLLFASSATGDNL